MMDFCTARPSQRHGLMLLFLLFFGLAAVGCATGDATPSHLSADHDRLVRKLIAEARKAAAAADNPQLNAELHFTITIIQAQAGWLEDAQATLQSIDTKQGPEEFLGIRLMDAYTELARMQLQAGQTQAALATYSQALAKIRQNPDTNRQAWNMLAIVRAQVAEGLTDQAKAVAQDIEQADAHVLALMAIAMHYHKQGQEATARSITAQAIAIARNDPAKHGMRTGLKEVAHEQAQMGWIEEATTLLQELQNAWEKGRVQTAIVNAHIKAGRIDQALAVAQNIEFEYEKVDALCDVARAFARSGQQDKARQLYAQITAKAGQEPNHFLEIAQSQAWAGLFEDTLQTVNLISKVEYRRYARQTIAQELTKVGRLDEALVIARQSVDPKDQALILSRIIRMQHELGHAATTGPLADEAHAAARNVLDPKEKTMALCHLAFCLTMRPKQAEQD